MPHVVKILGSSEETVQVARVPCVGEWIVSFGSSRRVTSVEHHPIPWAPFGALGGWAATITITGQVPVAVITVADE